MVRDFPELICITRYRLFPLMVMLCPLPLIVRSSVMFGRLEPSVIVPLTENVIVSGMPLLVLALMIACRREPAPLLLRLETV